MRGIFIAVFAAIFCRRTYKPTVGPDLPHQLPLLDVPPDRAPRWKSIPVTIRFPTEEARRAAFVKLNLNTHGGKFGGRTPEDQGKFDIDLALRLMRQYSRVTLPFSPPRSAREQAIAFAKRCDACGDALTSHKAEGTDNGFYLFICDVYKPHQGGPCNCTLSLPASGVTHA